MAVNLKDQFFLDPDITFLNHGSFGACAKPVYEDLLNWQMQMEREPVKFFEDTIFEFAIREFGRVISISSLVIMRVLRRPIVFT